MRIGVDTGGTFTDVVAIGEDGSLRVLKLPSTPSDPAVAVIEGVRGVSAVGGREGGADYNVYNVIHGTTVATNALLERRGGPTALITTEGFEDVLALRRHDRPKLYALHPVVPPPLVPDELRFGLPERLRADGSVLRSIDESALAELVERLRGMIARGEVRSIAVALLHSYANAEHERIVGARLAALGVPVSLSSDVLPEHREYERTSTTVVDAYVAPVVADYLSRLHAVVPALRVMQSSGGAASAAAIVKRPVRTILSGPAAGVVGARAVAAVAGIERIITFDMGGTSTDVALVDGAVEPDSEGEPSESWGPPVRVPSLRVHTVGAGGGSIAWRDMGGALKVGPRSAGAAPGPASYGRGGALPTVTDAALLLGRLHPQHFLGGAMALDEGAAQRAVATLAESLGLSIDETAQGVARVAVAIMARAIRVVSIERGHDPRDFTLVAFGGAGPMFACEVAGELDIPRVLVPPAPGLLCAYGALCADVTYDQTATHLVPAPPSLRARDLAFDLAPLEAAAHASLDADSIPLEERRLVRRCDLRYEGQSYELSIEIPGEVDSDLPREVDSDLPREVDSDLPREVDSDPSGERAGELRSAGRGPGDFDVLAAFHALHQRRYGFSDPSRPVERVALRVQGRGLAPPVPALRFAREEGPALLGDLHGAPARLRARLMPGETFEGPALFIEYSGTTWLPPAWRATVGEDGSLLLERR